VTRNVRTYDHFCLTARALERVGDRWSLLVIRDLLSGAKRFTDLMDRLGGITPKTLSQRLRELEDAGIVAVDREPGRNDDHDEIGHRRQSIQYRIALVPADIGMARVDRVDLSGEPVPAQVQDRLIREMTGPGRCADNCHRTRADHPPQSVDPGCVLTGAHVGFSAAASSSVRIRSRRSSLRTFVADIGHSVTKRK